MDRTSQKIAAWAGFGFVALFAGGLLVAGFIPPPSPKLGPTEVTAVYLANTNGIRAGMLLCMVASALILPFVALISAQMRRMAGDARLLAYVQLASGAVASLLLLLPGLFLGIAAFRPDRNPEVLSALNDIGWLSVITPFPPFLIQNFSIAMAIFKDRGSPPVLPRWVAYFNVWIALLLIPGGLAFFFRSGPFAWNGLLSFWIAAAAFFSWFIVMAVMLLKANEHEAQGTASPR